MVMPFALLDGRLIDLAIGFWEDPDVTLMKSFRRFEATVRERTGLDGEGVKLFKAAYFSDSALLYWLDIQSAERDARANLIAGTFGAYRNPRMHREAQMSEADQLAEFCLINKLFKIEAEGVEAERENQSDPALVTSLKRAIIARA